MNKNNYCKKFFKNYVCPTLISLFLFANQQKAYAINVSNSQQMQRLITQHLQNGHYNRLAILINTEQNYDLGDFARIINEICNDNLDQITLVINALCGFNLNLAANLLKEIAYTNDDTVEILARLADLEPIIAAKLTTQVLKNQETITPQINLDGFLTIIDIIAQNYPGEAKELSKYLEN